MRHKDIEKTWKELCLSVTLDCISVSQDALINLFLCFSELDLDLQRGKIIANTRKKPV